MRLKDAGDAVSSEMSTVKQALQAVWTNARVITVPSSYCSASEDHREDMHSAPGT